MAWRALHTNGPAMASNQGLADVQTEAQPLTSATLHSDPWLMVMTGGPTFISIVICAPFLAHAVENMSYYDIFTQNTRSSRKEFHSKKGDGRPLAGMILSKVKQN